MALVEDTLGQKVTQSPNVTLSNAQVTQINNTTTNTARPVGYYVTNGGEKVQRAPVVTVSSSGTKRISSTVPISDAPLFTTTIGADGTRTRTQLDSSTSKKISTERYNPSTGSRTKVTYTYGPDGKVKSSKATTTFSTPKEGCIKKSDGLYHIFVNGEDKGTASSLNIAQAKYERLASGQELTTNNGYVKQSDGLYHVFVNGEDVGATENLDGAKALYSEKIASLPEIVQLEEQNPIVSWYGGGSVTASNSDVESATFTSALTAASLAPKPVIAIDTDDVQKNKWSLKTLLESLEELIRSIQNTKNTLEQYNVLSGPIAEEILEMYSKLLKELMNEILTKFQSIDKFLMDTVPTLYGEADVEMASSYKTVKPTTSNSTSKKSTTVSSSSNNYETNTIKFYRIGS